MARFSFRSFSVLAALIAMACSDAPLTTSFETPAWAISDGAHGGLGHFYFLPPMVPSPNPTGEFDPSVGPVVDVCAVETGGCTSIATYDMATGPGSETVRLMAEEEFYAVNWHTNQFDLSAATTYRIRVMVDGRELGFADVDVVNGGGELKNVDTGQYVPLKDGRTLPIKFRIERYLDLEPPTAVVEAFDTDGQPLVDSRVPFGTAFVLDGSRSFDVGGGSIVEYVWTMPDGSQVSTTEPTYTVPVSPTEPLPIGSHTFGLVVADNSGNLSAPSTVAIVVVDDQVPTAVLSAPDRVPLGTSFVLDGSGSFDGGGGSIVEYAWTMPDGSQVSTTEPTYTVPVSPTVPLPLGSHTFGLIVVDDSGNRSAPSEVVVLVVDDQVPTAVLSAPDRVPLGTSFVLDGSRSFDVGGGSIVQYVWTMPDGSQVSTTEPTYTVPVSPTEPLPLGSHTFGLIVGDDSGNRSAPSEVVVLVVDEEAPTAVIRTPSVVPWGTSFVLDGSRSFDVGGGSIAQYVWTMPDGSQVSTTEPTYTVPVSPTEPLALGRHTFGLVVLDESGNQSSPDQQVVLVADQLPPTARIRAPSVVPWGTSFVLDGSQSLDVGGGSIAQYVWTMPDGSQVSTTEPTYTVTLSPTEPLPLGRHTFGLIVLDDSFNTSSLDEQVVLVADEEAPTAVIRTPSVVPWGTSFVLDGSRSFDVGGGTIAQYVWTMPDGSQVGTTEPTYTVTLSPTEPLPLGPHTFGLIVLDESGNQSSPDEQVVLVVDEQAPTAVLSAPGSVLLGTPILLDGSRSFDVGGGSIVQYVWTMPDGSQVSTTEPTYVPGVPLPTGQHTFGLVVLDESGNRSSPDQVVVTVF